MSNNIVTYIYTYEEEVGFIKHIKAIISNNDDSPNFFLVYKSSILLNILQNYKECAKFRLLIHLGSDRAKDTKSPKGNIITPLKNSDFFKDLKFDYATRDIEPFITPSDTYTFDKAGNVIHNANEMDGSIIDRMILYEIKNGKATGEIHLSKQNNKKSEVSVEKIVILTAMDLELKEVKKYLPNEKETIEDKEKQIFYEKYRIKSQKNKDFEVYVKVTGENNFASSSVTADVIKDLNPDYLFFVGIAGSLKDVDIGDVVIADTVENYEPGKDSDEGGNTRIYQGHADDFLLSLASSIITDGKDVWQAKIKVGKDVKILNKPKDKKGRIATGEKVLGSISSDLYIKIRHDCSKSLAVECEGGGFYYSCNKKNKKCLLIRGISDKLKDKGFVEEFNSQPYASSCASAFLFELIDLL